MSSSFGEFTRLRIVLPLAEKFVGSCASYWYRQLEAMSQWPKERIVEWQNKKLHDFVSHAYNHTVFYRKQFDSLGIKPEDIRCAADLKQLPIINKAIINEYHDEFVPDNLNQFKFRPGKTGGTTGDPMFYYCDENVWGYVTAVKMFHWKRAGYRFGDKFVAMGSSSLFSQKPSFPRRVYDKIRNEYPLNAVNLTDEICADYVKFLKKEKIKFIYGYAAAIYTFTRYVKEHGEDLSQIQAVFTTSENLTDHYRKLIEDTYQCKVMDCYGARDAGITAYESAKGVYQVGYNVLAEVVDQFEPNTGTLLSTNVLNYSFPMIRYQFGDEVELDDNVDESVYNGQVIRRIMGRTSDVMRLGNGHHLTSTGISMIMKEFDVVAFDFRRVNDLEITLRIQPIPEKYTADQEALIRKTFMKYIGEECVLNIEYVERFEPLKNGKRRYFYNEVDG